MDQAQAANGDFAKRSSDTGALYLDLAKLCVRLSLSKRTIRSFVNAAEDPLPAFQCGPGAKFLFSWAEVERWLRRHRVTDVASNLALDDLATQALSSLAKRERRV